MCWSVNMYCDLPYRVLMIVRFISHAGAKIPGGVGGCDTPPTDKTREFAGQLNPFAEHKFSLTVAHSAYRCCHGACEAPCKIKILKFDVFQRCCFTYVLLCTSFFAGQFPVSQGKSL